VEKKPAKKEVIYEVGDKIMVVKVAFFSPKKNM